MKLVLAVSALNIYLWIVSYQVFCLYYYINVKSNFIMLGVCATS